MNTTTNLRLTPGHQLFVGMQYSRDSAMSSHINLWRKLTRTPSNQFEVLQVNSEFNGTVNVLMFSNMVAYQEFEGWWQAYQQRFRGDEYLTAHIPSTSDGVAITGFPLRHAPVPARNRTPKMILDHFLREWYWICEFTQDRVIWTNDFWLFESEADMVMFKLKGVVPTEDEDGDNMPF